MIPDPAAKALGAAIGAATGTPFDIIAMQPVSGGCIHAALDVTGMTALGEQRYFAKVGEAERAPMFAAEADGLAAIAAANALHV
ncbi:MAG TPA: fructosamine kinase family protein, partial [Usitatibacter sp.]